MNERLPFDRWERRIPGWAVFASGFGVGVAAWLFMDDGRSPVSASLWWGLMLAQSTAFGFFFYLFARFLRRPLVTIPEISVKRILW